MIKQRVLVELKVTLLDQYALATDHNRKIIWRKAKYRSLAGLCVLLAVMLVLVEVALGMVSVIHGHP